MIAYDTGINWIWYLEYELKPDDTMTIIKHWRQHKYDDNNHPKAEISYRIDEDDNRIVNRVRLTDRLTKTEKWYVVLNPKYIFDYK